MQNPRYAPLGSGSGWRVFLPHNKKVLFTTICELNEHRDFMCIK